MFAKSSLLFVGKLLPLFWLAFIACADAQQTATESVEKLSDDRNILLSGKAGFPLKARLQVKKTGIEVSPELENEINNIQLLLSAAYTTKEGTPAGFFAVDGKVINNAVASSDGLVIIGSDGHLSLTTVDKITLSFANTSYSLRNQASRGAFIGEIAKNHLSVFQSHMIVIDGKNDVNPQKSVKKFIRRLLIETFDGRYLIYDSKTQPLTLYEAAQLAITHYNAVRVLNLDMGSYNYCILYDKSEKPENCGDIRSNQKLSNFLILKK